METLVNYVDEKLLEKIEGYAVLNSLDKTELINKLLETGYNLEVYGSSPFQFSEKKEIKAVDLIKPIKDLGLIEVKIVAKPEKSNGELTTAYPNEIQHKNRTEESTPFTKTTERKIKAK